MQGRDGGCGISELPAGYAIGPGVESAINQWHDDAQYPRLEEGEDWWMRARSTKSCVAQFFKHASTATAVKDSAFVACRTCVNARLPCIRYHDADENVYYVRHYPRQPGGASPAMISG